MEGYYFSDYEGFQDCFQYQKILNEKLEFPEQFIIEPNIFPLTVSLLIGYDSIKQLENEVNKCNEKLIVYKNQLEKYSDKNNWPNNFKTEGIDVWSGSSGSGVNTKRIAIPIVGNTDLTITESTYFHVQNYMGQDFLISQNEDGDFRAIIGQMYLYTFFCVFMSTLDNFSEQIKKLYSLNTDDINWGKYTSQLKFFSETFELRGISSKFNQEIVQKKIHKYRNRFAHSGHCRLDPQKTKDFTWKIYLPKEPNDPNSPFSYDVLRECPIALNKLVRFLNNSYKKITEKIDKDGQPPWNIKYK